MPDRQRMPFFKAAAFAISAILFRVRNSFRFAAFLLAACASIFIAPLRPGQQALQPAVQSSPQQVQQPTPRPQQGAPPPAASQQVAPPPSPHAGIVIVLDAAHGGTDDGARGPSGVVEKNLVLLFARTARAALEREGFRVVMTRNDDSNPSYDDRAAVANSYRDVIFVSFHISSTGTLHTARAYSYKFPDPQPDGANPNASAASTVPRPAKTPSLLGWEAAQRPYADASQSLANLVQTELAQRYPGWPGAY